MEETEGGRGRGRPRKGDGDKARPKNFKIPPADDALIDDLADDLTAAEGRPVNRTQVVLRAVRELRDRTPRQGSTTGKPGAEDRA